MNFKKIKIKISCKKMNMNLEYDQRSSLEFSMKTIERYVVSGVETIEDLENIKNFLKMLYNITKEKLAHFSGTHQFPVLENTKVESIIWYQSQLIVMITFASTNPECLCNDSIFAQAIYLIVFFLCGNSFSQEQENTTVICHTSDKIFYYMLNKLLHNDNLFKFGNLVQLKRILDRLHKRNSVSAYLEDNYDYLSDLKIKDYIESYDDPFVTHINHDMLYKTVKFDHPNPILNRSRYSYTRNDIPIHNVNITSQICNTSHARTNVSRNDYGCNYVTPRRNYDKLHNIRNVTYHKSFCGHCGNKCLQKFCTNCGNKI